ncbi:uncharacterized protein LOC125004357 [Mugil cephalus]|uniref:uncharacterized protein LOC125004357 n=1 Tax=Mugil cephalus TaxID=48193 RepID=UPI001FB809F9|nr:uncharacterized protein LOC125004357 [Mugil cephalus]XP_047434855.1 uncharacterized protein LOC125004357 [Mugil cephalus]
MPQNHMNFEGRRSRTRRNTYKANPPADRLGLDTGLVYGAFVHNGFSAAATGTSENTPASALCHTKPLSMVNGYINHGFQGESAKATPIRILRKQGSPISVAAAANRVSNADDPGATSVSGDTTSDAVALPQTFGQMEPEPSSAARKKQRRKAFKNKKRNTEVAFPDSSAPRLMPPQEKEDWENEIQDVTTTDWEKMCPGLRLYGPEDVLLSDLRDLTLKQRDDLPVTPSYSPAIHHPRPIQWSCYNIPTEPDQFADADE